jgi:hypothetical protein
MSNSTAHGDTSRKDDGVIGHINEEDEDASPDTGSHRKPAQKHTLLVQDGKLISLLTTTLVDKFSEGEEDRYNEDDEEDDKSVEFEPMVEASPDAKPVAESGHKKKGP